jgi:hypothetical protein
MENKEIISKLFNELDSRNYDSAADLIDESFKISGPFPEPFNKNMWLGSTKGLHAAFSNLRFNATNYEETGDKVSFSVKITGTHDGELALPNMPSIPATGKSVANPEERGMATITDGKVVSMEMSTTEDGGLKGLLKQLGIEPPH